MNYSSVKIGELYNKCLAKGYDIITTPSGHELICPTNLKVRTAGNRFQKVKWLSRHRTSKELVKIVFQKAEPLVVTTDHVCMAYNDDRMLERTASKDLRCPTSTAGWGMGSPWRPAGRSSPRSSMEPWEKV